jgi:virginiamycin B lyase
VASENRLREALTLREQMAGQFAARIQWSTLLRGAAVAFATLAVAAFAFAARADALIYWANSNSHTIGFATFDTKIVDQNFIHVAGVPNGVAVYGDYVYWTVPGANAIGRAGMNGTGVNQTFIQGLQGPQGVAVNSAGIFWTNAASGSIGRANLDGSGVNQSFIGGASPSNLITADATHLYWTIAGFQFTRDAIARADVSGDNLNTTFITGDAVNSPEGVAVDDAHVYWTSVLGEAIGQANLSDGSGANGDFIDGVHNPTGIAVNAGQLYWSNFVTNSLGTADTSGGNVNQTFLPAAGPEGVAAEPLIPAPTPPPTIADLIAEVTGAGLPHGTERSLLVKLDNAQRKVDGGQIAVACNGLDAYLNKVRAQNGKKLDPAYAQDLIDTARAVQDALGCGTT